MDVNGIVGESRSFLRALERLRLAAAADVPLLLTGESGTGKEVMARLAHDESSRSDGPFVPVNITAVPENLIEAELFGHERGAFTGAEQSRPGLFVEANGGTLLLDEIGDLPLALQCKLLRVLQEGEVRPLGSRSVVQIDVRTIFATHRDLTALVAEGKFREDLFYRVSVFATELPPLRERCEDIVPLVRHVLRKRGEGDVELTPSAEAALKRHSWPGNVRELENAVHHALVLKPPGAMLCASHLPTGVLHSAYSPTSFPTLWAAREALERREVLKALAAVGGSRTLAARRLGMSRQSLHVRLKRYGIGAGAGRLGETDAEGPGTKARTGSPSATRAERGRHPIG